MGSFTRTTKRSGLIAIHRVTRSMIGARKYSTKARQECNVLINVESRRVIADREGMIEEVHCQSTKYSTTTTTRPTILT